MQMRKLNINLLSTLHLFATL